MGWKLRGLIGQGLLLMVVIQANLKGLFSKMEKGRKLAFAARLGALLLALAPGLALAQVPPANQCLATALAGGTGDAITLPLLPCTATTTLVVVKLTATNLAPAPTMQVVGQAALPVVREDGGQVQAGELVAGSSILFTTSGAAWIKLTPGAVTTLPNLTLPWPASFPGNVPVNGELLQVGGVFPVAGEIPAGVVQAANCTMTIPNSYTQGPWPPVCFTAYIDNQNSANPNSAVGFLTSGWANAPGTGTSGNNVTNFNGILSNTDPANGYGAGTAANKGKDFGEMIGFESDFNIWKKVAGVTPGGKVSAFVAIGGGEVVPSGGANAFRVGAFAAGLPWTNGFVSDAGAAVTGVRLGAVSTSAGAQASQGLQMDAQTAANATVSGTLQVVPDGGTADMNLGVPSSGLMQVLVNSAVQYSLGGTGLFGTSLALATGATGPFIYINSVGGTPSGVPTNASVGRIALVFDNANHKICAYDQPVGVWKCTAALT